MHKPLKMLQLIQPLALKSIQVASKRCLSSLSPKILAATYPLAKSMDKLQVLPVAAQQRCQHTVANMSSLEKMKWDLGFYGKLRESKNVLHLSGFKLYVCCTDLIDFGQFVKELNIPDSFTSWYLVLQLHLWLVHVKLAQMGKEGLLLTQNLYKNMWVDVERRLNTFEELLGSEKREAMKNFHSVMCSSILYYDEGLLGSDTQLANSLWVQLFSMDEGIDPKHLGLMVEYVRKQVHHLDSQSEDLVMKPGYISFLPLHGTQLQPGQVEKDMERISRRQNVSK